MRELVLELAGEEGVHSRQALIRNGQGKAYLKRRYREGRILPLNPAPPISEAVIDCSVLKAEHVNCPELSEAARAAFGKSREKSVRGIVGGGISERTIPFLGALDGLIVGFETRKVAFGRYVKEKEALREAIRTALRFEYLGCHLRRETYLQLYREDEDKTRKIEAMPR